MIPKPRSLRVPRNPIGLLILLAAFAAAAGCSTANTPGGGGVVVNHVDASGNSVPGWFTPTGGAHANSATMDYIANGGKSSCTECHGPDLGGGISRVSCFNTTGCHHDPIQNWSTPAVHGAAAKRAPGSSGFASCQICHGADFRTVRGGITCFTCHASAPHAPAPWRASAGTTFTHTNTDPANAPVCYSCHADSPSGNPNNPHRPPSPASAGTPPGCFNGTMCHNQPAAPHPLDNAWVTTPPAAQPHGNDAKAAPGATTGFSYCQDCHGAGTTPPANFGGGSSGVSCYLCHANAPHAPAPWRTSAGSTYSHTSTDAANAPVCAQCHFPGSLNNPPGHPPTPAEEGTPPGCFNSTLCHGSVAPHPVPYNDSSHYEVTSTTFPGTCGACHDVSAPSTKVGPVCQTCHVAASPLTAADCTSCHAAPPDGAAPAGSAYANIPGAHGTHIALNSAGTPISCDTCHNGLGTGTLNHYNRAKARVPPGDASFLATYNAKSGASSFDNGAALSCSNVSCHGGQATPNWQSDALVVNDQCTFCHALGTAQYNSYNSGEHDFHLGLFGTTATSCKYCHNTTTLVVDHFTTLADNTISPAVASATVGGAGTLITTWTPGAGTSGTCDAACHPGNRTW